MTAIWLIFALMTGLAVLALLWPMSRRPAFAAMPEGEARIATETGFYRDQLREIDRDAARGLLAAPEAEAARAEAARRLLRASREPGRNPGAVGEPALRRRRAASAFALSTVPLVALLVYGIYGSPDLPAQPQAERLAHARAAGNDLAAAVAQIEAHLAKAPEDGRGWTVIAPVYLRLGRTEDAIKAYENSLRLLGDDAGRLADYGEALTAAGDGVVSSKARDAFERALRQDPKAVKPQFYLARAAEQDGDREKARSRYAAMEAAASPDAPWLPLVRESLARLDGTAAPAAPAAARTGMSDEQKGMIRGMVEGLAQRLAEKGGSPEEWGRLVRSYMVLGDRPKAEATLAQARAALGSDPAKVGPVEEVARELGLDPAKAVP
ncbi:c-type cytochrome biogenesis protein CcmI [Methylobacterium platani]|uniref:C-type cytochrome biogenesis protein CcmI n=2 Tax=Methylobacterium platani TaxID=427683 RepID=A0A179SE09_9HYPH|nr:c-type cytochrome biogenesis protein CcmI [Methylobacterium platani]KMO17183.1 cytochrome C biogenesis protein CcmI [Methylobacterium platani JCM 14648]OAS25829.1 c-type cytochrome biogenesis protein CcmI [Methylobacterium platani]